MIEWKPWQETLLKEVANTFVPAIKGKEGAFWKFEGGTIATSDWIALIISQQSKSDQNEFFQLLKLMKSPLLGLTWRGGFRNFISLSHEEREQLFLSWSKSKQGKLRKSFVSLKKIFTFLSYGLSNTNGHPSWEIIGFPGPISQPIDKAKPISLFHPQNTDQIVTQVLVIGSGAGGGVIAGELSKAGLDVLVVEKGSYYNEADFNQREAEMVSKLYEQSGALNSRDGGIVALAGSCLGGGTTVNWAGSFQTPDFIRQEWAHVHGNSFFAEESFQHSLEMVSQRISVQSGYGYHNPQNAALYEASKKLGHKIGIVPINQKLPDRDTIDRLGFGSLGDQYGDKQGTLKTYLQDAFENGARIMANTEIQKLIIEGGRIKGAEGIYTGTDGNKKTIKILADRVFVCAGSIHTPALLIRSGLTHLQIGRNLYLHPTVGIAAHYKQEMNSWYGPMMSAVNDEFTRVTDDYGFKLETPPMQLGQLAMSMPWTSGFQHKNMMLRAKNLGSFIVLARDKFAGKITVDVHGKPSILYNLHSFDRDHLLKGMIEATNIHLTAGAEEVYFPHNSMRSYIKEQGIEHLDDLANGIKDWGWLPNQFMLFTAHQMGTCRMGSNDKKDPLKPNGEMREVKNLYVADASTFPSASGANPMLTIMAIAHHIANELVG